MSQGAEGRLKLVEAASETSDVAVAVEPERQRQGKVRTNFPLILAVETGAVHGQGFGAHVWECLREGGAVRERAVQEVSHREERQKPELVWLRCVGAHPVFSNVSAHFEGVGAPHFGKIIEQLPLPHFAALRICVVAATYIGEWRAIAKCPCTRERLDRARIIRRAKDRGIVRSRKEQLIHHCRAKRTRVAHLPASLRLHTVCIERRVDRIGARRLNAAIHVVPEIQAIIG